jgi:AcrR family transcriptional regulator
VTHTVNPTAGAKGGERLYGGHTAEERRAERRRRLLDTALELFGTDGYSATGIERICSHAGVTARHFYDEFGSRENLLTALYDEIGQTTLESVATAVADIRDDPVATVRAAVNAFLHSMLDDPRHARIQCLEVVGVSPALEAHRRAALHLYAQIVADQIRALGVVDVRREHSRFAGSLALVGGTNELLIEYLTRPDHERPTMDELTEDIVDIYIAVGRFPRPT